MSNSSFIAIGSNLGDRVSYIRQAIEMVTRDVGPLRRTSFLYETAPQYVTDQPSFLNAVLEITTHMSPVQLIETLKQIEKSVGRVPSIRYGPRAIDLDILLYNNETIQISETSVGALEIPHPRLPEREFVLRPLVDIAPVLVHPVINKTMRELLEQLEPSTEPPVRVLPLSNTHLVAFESRTYVMGIINVTPDSFSDGDENIDVEKIATKMIQAGCDIIDIGGESTRPGADPVSLEVELSRVLPAIQAIRKMTDCPISIDTTKSIVAREAIKAGANLVNDVSGGQQDPEMLQVVASLGVPIVLMHRRGTPETMTQLKEYDNVVTDVSNVLREYFDQAQAVGISRWNIIVDPGIGFAKGRDLNLEILRNMKQLVDLCDGAPVLIGASRKKFIGEICNRPIPSDRVFGTAATCCAAVQGGAHIIRVHDVAEMVDVIRMSDAIWKH